MLQGQENYVTLCLVPLVHGSGWPFFIPKAPRRASFFKCPPISMEEGDNMNVSHTELYQFCMLVIAIIRLVMDIKKK
jgi:hypothetical protein